VLLRTAAAVTSLGYLMATTLVAGSPVVDAASSSEPLPAPAAAAAAVRSCQSLAGSLSLADQVGQLFMVGISSDGLSSSEAKVLRSSHAGSVIFLGTNRSGVAKVRSLSSKVRKAGVAPQGIAMMVTVDQEGGLVQRLRGPGFERMPTARNQARLGDAKLAAKATIWGRQLRAAGVNANLAPVADVVPKSLERVNQPIGRLDRGYGPDPAVVARKTSAFVKGMEKAGVTTAVKHFPGLGRVRGNTDFEERVVDTSTVRHAAGLRPFRSGVTSGTDMVMVSSAIYSKIDARNRAAFSPYIIGQMIRRDLKFGGVVISDDLSARAMRDVSPGQRALRFLRAGGDLAIVGDPRQAGAMTSAVNKRARTDKVFAHHMTIKAGLVLRMKARHGLAPRCS
jgi:beta-N-acetylhexosaminidase